MLRIMKLTERCVLPTRAHEDDAGLDLYCIDKIVITGHEIVKVGLGFAAELTGKSRHVIMFCDRSSMGSRGIKVMGGIIDEGYRGEWIVTLANVRNSVVWINAGSKIAQALILPIMVDDGVMVVDELSKTMRGSSGFGSTNHVG